MYDCIIIGTGPAGLSAALNLKTYGKTYVWFGSKNLSEKVQKAELVTNYPGFPDISGSELLEKFSEHIRAAGLEITEKTVTNVVRAGNRYMVLADNEIYEAATILIATGVMNAKLLEGENELLGRGVSYCATCDGNFYKGKKIAVLCNAKKFEHEVEFLAGLAEEVYYYPTFESGIRLDNVLISHKIPRKINGEARVESVTLSDGESVPVDGIFCLRNAIAPSSLIPGIQMENGHIVVNRDMETNLPGCFAAGDCTGRPYQYTKAVGEGNVAAHSIIAFLHELEQKD